MVQRLIADMTVEIEAARLLTYKSALLEDKGEATTRESSHSKYFAAETLWNAAQALTEIYGGRAVALEDEYPVSRYPSWANLFRQLISDYRVHADVYLGAPDRRIGRGSDTRGPREACQRPLRNAAFASPCTPCNA